MSADSSEPRNSLRENPLQKFSSANAYFRDRCSQALGKARFRDVLAASSDDPAALWAFRKRVVKLLSWTMPAQPETRDPLDDILIASAPAYRVESLYHSDEGLLRFLVLAELLARRVYTMSIAASNPARRLWSYRGYATGAKTSRLGQIPNRCLRRSR